MRKPLYSIASRRGGSAGAPPDADPPPVRRAQSRCSIDICPASSLCRSSMRLDRAMTRADAAARLLAVAKCDRRPVAVHSAPSTLLRSSSPPLATRRSWVRGTPRPDGRRCDHDKRATPSVASGTPAQYEGGAGPLPAPPPTTTPGRSGRVGRPELHRDAVHAVAQARRLRAVVEDVAEMPAATGAMD